MSQPSAPASKPYPQSYLAGLLSYLIPGLGQIYQGRISKGLMFMVCLLGMFIGGQALGDWHNVYLPRDNADNNGLLRQLPPAHCATVFSAGTTAGNSGSASRPGRPFGSTATSGAERRAVAVPAQLAEERRTKRSMNDYLVTRDKTPDLAWVYTVVAGILNILVIYDAFAGPAHAAEEEPAK